MKNNKLLIYVVMTFSMIFWGFSFIWTKMILEFYQPITIIFFRLIISSAFLFLLNYWLKRIQKIEKQHRKWLILLSFFQPFLYFIGESYGLTYISTTLAAVLVSTIPLFTPLVAYLFFRERITFINFLGICISIAGVFLVILKKDFTFSASTEGILLLFLAVASAIAYSVILVKLSAIYHVYTIISYQNLIGILWFLPFFLIFDFQSVLQTGFIIEAFWPLLALAFFASSLAYLFFTYGVQKMGVIKANAFTNSIPVFTAIFAYIMLGERLTLINFFGMLLVVAGLFMVQLGHSVFALTKLFFYKWRNGKEF